MHIFYRVFVVSAEGTWLPESFLKDHFQMNQLLGDPFVPAAEE